MHSLETFLGKEVMIPLNIQSGSIRLGSNMQSLIQKPMPRTSTRHTTKLIEDTIKDSETYLTTSELRSKLKGKVSQTQLTLILRKLLRENKIIYHKGNTILWTHTDHAQEQAAKKYFTKLD